MGNHAVAQFLSVPKRNRLYIIQVDIDNLSYAVYDDADLYGIDVQYDDAGLGGIFFRFLVHE